MNLSRAANNQQYPFLGVIRNLYFHPLSSVPGPKLWSSSRLPFVRALLRGSLIHDVEKLHRKYGPVVRIAPDEVTFAQPEAWTDILRADRPMFLKDPVWWAAQPDLHEALMTAIQPESHARIRKILAPAFTTRALKAQETILQHYVNLLIERLRDHADRKAVIDIAPWFNFTTFDIFGDLGYGESFKCLEDSRYHPWISMIFNSEKGACYIYAARFYPLIEWMLMKCIPPSVKKVQHDHRQFIVDKVQRRLNFEVERPDIMSYVIKENKDRTLPLETINSTFLELTTAGSDTVATVLGGTLNYLVRNPDKLGVLEQEVRRLEEGDLNLNTLQDLVYLNAVLKEGLRLCPPVPWILPRRVPHEGAFICGTWLPAGTAVSIQAYSMNRNPEYFYKASLFLPERWLPDAMADPLSPFSHDRREAVQPFSVGPWSCLGQNLAWAEMRLILAKLLWTFDFEAGNRLDWENLKTFLLVEKKPIEVKMRVRKGLASH
uniref:Cytochrome P450 monooxygenase n=1 Tax=Nodulisporium sp. TaxID=1897413 RepID=A0A2R4QF37_9PEZI|nr:cytochrome P450 monooxygenase [Nodulisporium sp.]